MATFRKLLLVIGLFPTFLMMNFTHPIEPLAFSTWQPPEWIPGLVDTSQAPYFVADPTGKVHVFNSQRVDNDFMIVYSSWTVGVGWTVPVDIIAIDAGQARISGAFVDDEGMMNVVFWGGDDLHADMFITRSPLYDVKRSSAWSLPLLIGQGAIAPTTAAVVSDEEGCIVVVFAGNEEGNGLYSMTSQDYGVTWSKSTPFYFSESDELWPTALEMIMTEDQTVQAVWALGDQTGNSRRIYYASSSISAEGWNSPIVLAEAAIYEADTPSIIKHDNSLIVIYHNDFPTTRFMTRSFDGGTTWTDPVRLFEQVGSNGSAALVVDSSNTLHMFFCNRIDASGTHGVWHSILHGDTWEVPTPVVSGPLISDNAPGEEGFGPSYAQALVSQGNLLFVAWRQDPIADPVHIWFTFNYLDTFSLPTQVVPVPTARVTSTPLRIVTPTSMEGFSDELDQSGIQLDTIPLNLSILLGMGPVFVLVVVILYKRLNKH